MLDHRIQAWEPPVQNIRQLEAALHREWQQLSQQDIRPLTEVNLRVWVLSYGIQHNFQQFFSFIVAVSFIGGGNWRKSSASH